MSAGATTNDVTAQAPSPPAPGPDAASPARPTGQDAWWAWLWRALRAFVTSLSLAGMSVGILAFTASTQPSLVPRGWVYQGAISGFCLLFGYAVGVLARWLLRVLGLPRILPAHWRARARWVVLGLFVVVAVIALTNGAATQRRLAQLWGLEPTHSAHLVSTLALALVLFCGLLLLARGLRAGWRALSGLLHRWVPRPVSAVVSFAVIVALIVWIVSGAFNTFVLNGITTSFVARDAETPAGITQPSNPERSGSPESLQAWEDLGFEGRNFAGGGPTRAEIEAFTGRAAMEPIRVYGGAASVTDDLTDVDLDALASAVVAELDRTNAWDREVVAVVTTTGTGWVDPLAAAALEYLHGGDTAIAAMQYSVNPSWVQLLLNLEQPAAAGIALFDAVQARWAELPAESRPQLVPFGISLGAYGSQAAFSSVPDLAARASGAVWAGTPSFTSLRNAVADSREPGSPQIHPIITPPSADGWNVRFGTQNGGDQLFEALGPAGHPRVAFLQHPSDGVVWWWFDVAWSEPDWLREPPGQDVLPGMRWYPFITGMQTMGDQFLAGSPSVPLGYGHNYGEEYVDAWNWVTQPTGWDDASLARLRALIATLPR